jgi:hypothetical protein
VRGVVEHIEFLKIDLVAARGTIGGTKRGIGG